MITTILFDMDGTLLNTIDDISDSVNATLTHFNYPTRLLDEIKSFVGNGARNLIVLALSKDVATSEVDTVLDYYLEHYKLNIQNKTAPYEDIMTTLSTLHQLNYQLGILSNKPDNGVKELNSQYFSNYISHAFGEVATINKKPSKDGVLRAIKEMNCKLDQVIYVGDSEVDVLTAKNSGIPCIACSWGFRSKEELMRYNPEYIIDSPLEIISIMKQLNAENK